MSDDSKPYNQLYIQAWTTLSIIVTAGLFLVYTFGTKIMDTCHWIWDLLRYLASPII